MSRALSARFTPFHVEAQCFHVALAKFAYEAGPYESPAG